MAVLILAFFLLEGYVGKLRSVGISSVIAFALFFISVAVVCVPAVFNITCIKTVSHVISFLAHWPTVAVFKILNLEHLAIRSYQMSMLIEIGKFIINTFMILGKTRLMLNIKYKMTAKKLRLKEIV
jgi:hypothetical protein